MPATGALQRHTGVEQRHRRRADRAHRRRAVGAQRLGHLPDRVRELLARRQHGQERPLGQRAVADLAALRRADPAGLTGRVRREVVVVQVALAGLRAELVDLLLHAQHVQRGDTHDLGLAALEQRRAVRPRDDLDLGRQRPDVGEPAAVDPDLVGQDPAADQLLVQRPERGADLLLAALELRGHLLQHGDLDLVQARLALLLVADRQRLREVVRRGGGHGLEDVGLVRREGRVAAGRLRRDVRQLLLGHTQGADERLRGLEAGGDDVLGGRLGAIGDQRDRLGGGLGLHHHDRDVGGVPGADDPPGDDHVEHGPLELLVGGERDPRAVDESDAHAADRAAERQAGELRRGRRGVDRDDVVGVLRVQRHDRDDDLDLVAQTVDERRAQRTVDQPAGQDRVGARAALAAEERAGDAARGVHALFDVHREREEVEVLLGLLRRRGGGEQHGLVVQVGDDGAGRLPGEAPGLEADGAGAEAPVVQHRGGLVDAVGVVLGVCHGGGNLPLQDSPRPGRILGRAGLRSKPPGKSPGATTEDRRIVSPERWQSV